MNRILLRSMSRTSQRLTNSKASRNTTTETERAADSGRLVE